MMMRYLAFWEFMGTATVVMILDSDLPWQQQLEGLLFDIVYKPELECQVVRGAFHDYFDTNHMIMGGLFGLRGEALLKVGNAIRPIIERMADELDEFAYGCDQTVLAVSVFPLIQEFNALTMLISSHDEATTWKHTSFAAKLPAGWRFQNDTFYERRCFVKKEIMG
jgi:hypothetical protein